MAQKIKSKIQKLLSFCSKIFDKAFWLIPLVSLVASLWFPLILKIIGTKFGFLNNQQQFTKIGIIVTILVMSLPVFMTIIKVAAEKTFDEKAALKLELSNEQRKNGLLSALVDSFDSLCDNKEQKIIRTMQSHQKNEPTYNPNDQLENILKEIDNNLSFLLSDSGNRIRPNDLYVSLYYAFDNSNDWHCANIQQRGMPTEELLEKNTTFRYLLSKKTSNFVFYNSKEVAYSESRYAPDDLDRYDNDKIVGSIAGYKFSIRSNETKYVDMILFITTYGKKFVDLDDKYENSTFVKNVKSNVEQVIIEKYVRRIKIEFGTLYLKEHS